MRKIADEGQRTGRAAAGCKRRDAAIPHQRAHRDSDAPRQLPDLSRRPLRAARPQRLRQVLAAEGGRRLHGAGRGRIPPARPAHPRAGAGPHDGVPGVRPTPAVEDGDGERAVPAARDAAPRPQAGPRASAALHRQGRAVALRRRLSPHPLRRHEAARGHRARHGDGTRNPVDGRTLCGAGRAHPPHHAGRASPPVGRHQVHGAVRDPLHQRGDPRRQPHPLIVGASRPGAEMDSLPREGADVEAHLGLERHIHELLFA